MRFEYRKARDLNDALKLIKNSNAKFIAGGTDILVDIKNKVQTPAMLVDIGALPCLRQITDRGSHIEIGALVTHEMVLKSQLLNEKAPLLVEGCRAVGSPQIRARGTIGGNLITASPAGDTIPALVCLEGIVRLRSMRQEREVTLESLFIGVKKTVIEPDELLVSISIKTQTPDYMHYYMKLGQRNSLAISKVTLAMLVRFSDDLTVTGVKISLGAVAPTVIRAHRTEEYLLDKKIDSNILSHAKALIQKESKAISDIRSKDWYRDKMVGVLLNRGLSLFVEKKV